MREQIEKSLRAYLRRSSLRQAHNVLDSRLVEEGTVRAHTAALEQKVAVLQQELAHARRERRRHGRGRRAVGDGRQHQHRASCPEERAASIRTGIVEAESVCSFRSRMTRKPASTAKICRCKERGTWRKR
ncbi:MAG: hypothetical protein ACLR4Z_09910 [Butyricicoccaceae bacterium]